MRSSILIAALFMSAGVRAQETAPPANAGQAPAAATSQDGSSASAAAPGPSSPAASPAEPAHGEPASGARPSPPAPPAPPSPALATDDAIAKVALASAELPAVPTAEGGEALRVLALGGAPASLPPVTAQLFHVGGRLELEPLFSVSVGDPFYRTLGVGVRGEQHLGERVSLGAHLLGGGSLIAAPVQLCGSGPCSAPEAARLRSAPGDLQFMSGLELGFSPIYGKLSLVGEKTMHFDAYVSVGPELVRERIAADATSDLHGRWGFGGRVALGERMFFSDTFTVRLGASETVYGARVRGHAEIERKLMLEAGAAWLFGAGR